jgi:hypothetical protein
MPHGCRGGSARGREDPRGGAGQKGRATRGERAGHHASHAGSWGRGDAWCGEETCALVKAEGVHGIPQAGGVDERPGIRQRREELRQKKELERNLGDYHVEN